MSLSALISALQLFSASPFPPVPPDPIPRTRPPVALAIDWQTDPTAAGYGVYWSTNFIFTVSPPLVISNVGLPVNVGVKMIDANGFDTDQTMVRYPPLPPPRTNGLAIFRLQESADLQDWATLTNIAIPFNPTNAAHYWRVLPSISLQ